jgi:hypothetical protein
LPSAHYRSSLTSSEPEDQARGGSKLEEWSLRILSLTEALRNRLRATFSVSIRLKAADNLGIARRVARILAVFLVNCSLMFSNVAMDWRQVWLTSLGWRRIVIDDLWKIGNRREWAQASRPKFGHERRRNGRISPGNPAYAVHREDACAL